MAAAINFSGQALLQQSMSFRAREGMALISLPTKGLCMPTQQKIKIQHGMSLRKQLKTKSSTTLSSTRFGDFELSPSPFSASDMIGEFYKCINEKNSEELHAYISNNCYFEECSFPKPFEGKQVTSLFVLYIVIKI